MTVTLAFYKAEGELLDQLIRWWTRGPYSHVEIVVGDPIGEVTILSSSPRDGGVRQRRITIDPDHWDLLMVDAEELSATALVLSQRGRGYDWLGIIFNFVLPLRWQSRRRWFCSEICGAALGLPEPHLFHPNSLFQLLRQLGHG